MDVYEQAVGGARVYRGGRMNAHEEVLSAQQDLSGMGSMKKGGVFITGGFIVSPVTRNPGVPAGPEARLNNYSPPICVRLMYRRQHACPRPHVRV